jgi:hypothetical protein
VSRRSEAPLALQKEIQKFAPGFEAGDLGLRGAIHHKVFRDSEAVMTHPFSRTKPALLAGKKVLKDTIVGAKTVGKNKWLTLEIDLTKYAGQDLDLTLECRANNWANEWAYWPSVEVVSE